MRLLTAAFAALLFALPISAGDVKKKAVPLVVKGDTVTVVRQVPFTVEAAPGAALYVWTYPDGVKATENEHVLTVTACPKGSFTVRVKSLTIDFEKKVTVKDSGEIEINYGGAAPGPDPVPPPGPDPKPDPDAPIPAAGLHVLIVEDVAKRKDVPAKQLQILFDKRVRDYLAARCPAGRDGKTPERRIWDAHVDASRESKLWQDALKRANGKAKSYPWIIVSNGKTGYEGPLPATVEETLALLKKYGD